MSEYLITLPCVDTLTAASSETVSKKDSFREIQRRIGGTITLLAQGAGWDVYVDDEGMLKNLPLNEACTYLLHKLDRAREAEHIFGNAVFIFSSKRSGAYRGALEWLNRFKNNELSDQESDEEDVPVEKKEIKK